MKQEREKKNQSFAGFFCISANARERQETSSFSSQFKKQTVYTRTCKRLHDHKVGGGRMLHTHWVLEEEGLCSPGCHESDTDSQQCSGPGQTSVPSSRAWISSGGLH